ncbi:hypothetical protein ACNS7O_05660 [Haloferacaceae archaeon DSL9]
MSATIPIGTVVALAAVCAIPLATFLLYLVDKRRGDGSITIFGRA